MKLRIRDCIERRELPLDSGTLDGKLVSEVDNFSKQAWHKRHWQPPQSLDMHDCDSPRLGWIAGKALCFQIAGKHGYTNSRMSLPLDCDGENPIIAPMLGTRSID